MSPSNANKSTCNQQTCKQRVGQNFQTRKSPTEDTTTSWQNPLPNRAYCFGSGLCDFINKKARTNEDKPIPTSAPQTPIPESFRESIKQRLPSLGRTKDPSISKSAMLLCPHCLQAIPENVRRIISQELLNLDIQDIQKAKINLEVGIPCNCGGYMQSNNAKRPSILRKSVQYTDESVEVYPPIQPRDQPYSFTRKKVPDTPPLAPPSSPIVEDTQYIEQLPEQVPLAAAPRQPSYPSKSYDDSWTIVEDTQYIEQLPKQVPLAAAPRQPSYPNKSYDDSWTIVEDTQYIEQLPKQVPLAAAQRQPSYPNKSYDDSWTIVKSQQNSVGSTPGTARRQARIPSGSTRQSAGMSTQLQQNYPDTFTQKTISDPQPNIPIADNTQYVEQLPVEEPLVPEDQKPLDADQPVVVQDDQQQPSYPNNSFDDTFMTARTPQPPIESLENPTQDNVPDSQLETIPDTTEESPWVTAEPIPEASIPEKPIPETIPEEPIPETIPEDINQMEPITEPEEVSDIPFTPVETSTPRESLKVEPTEDQPEILDAIPPNDDAPPEVENPQNFNNDPDQTVVQTALLEERKNIINPSENCPPTEKRKSKLRFLRTRPRTLRQCALAMRKLNLVPIKDEDFELVNTTKSVVQYVDIQKYSDKYLENSFEAIYQLSNGNNSDRCENIVIKKLGYKKYLIKCRSSNYSINSSEANSKSTRN